MKKYQGDIDYVAGLDLPWEKLEKKTILISGATGMIGTFLIHVLMERNLSTRIIAVGRKERSAKDRFGEYWGSKNFQFIVHDINQELNIEEKADFIIHAASNTHPVAYALDPIGTITTNILGTYHLLNYAAASNATRFLFTSSVEVYGENRGDVEYFDENYCGYIDCNTLRAGYPESKRAGEALCQAYRRSRGIDVVIARLSRTYGPTMLFSDSKAISQFIKNGIAKENIVLKSEGKQLYSYNYVADSVSGLLTVLLRGDDGEAYNIADRGSDITLKDLARLIASYVGTQVVFEFPVEMEQAGYSKATKALMSSDKLRALGWEAHWNMEKGLIETLQNLEVLKNQLNGNREI